MPTWDTADLVKRCKRYAAQPNAVEAPAPDADVDEMWHELLTEAEARWKPILAVHDPGPMYGPPVKMETTDGGYTYRIPGVDDVLGPMEIYFNSRGTLLRPGAYWDWNADYVQEGATIRMTAGRQRSFSDGPWARYIAAPGVIDEDTDSTIQPAHHRILLVFDALERWASRGGRRDPSYYTSLLQKAAYGDPQIPGDIGVIGAAKQRNLLGGMTAVSAGADGRWWHSPDLDRMGG